jgi:hypothetical protein
MPVKEREYWFARRFPIGNPRSGMAPVHWKGWLVAWAFLALMLGGAGAFVWFALEGNLIEGAAMFAIIAFIAGVWFVLMATANGDRVRTVADYREVRKRV